MGAPADAIREFNQTLTDMQIAAVVANVKADVAGMRRAFPADDDFAAALSSVSRRLRSLRVAHGTDLDHTLSGWLRVKLSSTVVDHADLRIIYRAGAEGIELRAFGHRRDPESIYLRAAGRR